MGLAAAAGISAIGAIGGGLIASSGASHAANIQSQADQAAIGEQQREFNTTNSELAPFRSAGLAGLSGYGNLLGTNGGPAQQQAITALQSSPLYQSLYRNGLEATLANASATGGLRGGNAQRSLANFGADTLASTINNQLGYLGGLAGMGLGATNATGQFGQNAANNISNITVSQGQTNANAAAAQAGALSGIFKNLTSLSSFLPSIIPNSSVGNSGQSFDQWASGDPFTVGGF